jgi:hypothetical protein
LLSLVICGTSTGKRFSLDRVFSTATSSATLKLTLIGVRDILANYQIETSPDAGPLRSRHHNPRYSLRSRLLSDHDFYITVERIQEMISRSTENPSNRQFTKAEIFG